MKNKALLYIYLCLIAPAAFHAQTSTQQASTKRDLKITITGVKQYANPGESIALEVAIFQVNGSAPQQDIRVDLALGSKRSYRIPVPTAVYSPEFSEGVLLKGGRTFCTVPASGMFSTTLYGTLPADLPSGEYYIVAVVDAGNSVAEWDEYNNVDYLSIEVNPGSGLPSELVFKDFQTVLKKHEVYMAGERKNEGQIFKANEEENALYGNASPVYQPKSVGASALAFSPKEELYFVDATKFDIYRTNGETEVKVYSHHTYIRDVVFDKQGSLFFSEASGSGANGTIYKFNFKSSQATKYLSVPLSQVEGYWAGDFAFSPTNQLYLSSGDRIPASLFKFENSKFEKVYTHKEGSIRGFFFLNSREILFAGQGKELFFLRNFSEKVQALETKSIERIEDVWLLAKPAAGQETINVRFKDGNDMWDLTAVNLRGPNLYWRMPKEGYSQRVSTNGTALFSSLSRGIYWLSTDIRADLGWGFRPRKQVVNCAGKAVNVEFHKPVKGVDF